MATTTTTTTTMTTPTTCTKANKKEDEQQQQQQHHQQQQQQQHHKEKKSSFSSSTSISISNHSSSSLPQNEKIKEEEEEEIIIYQTGIPTLRSAVHRVRSSKHPSSTTNSPSSSPPPFKNKHTHLSLPPSIRQEEIFTYNSSKYPLAQSITTLLSNLSKTTDLVGHFPSSSSKQQQQQQTLEYFKVPPKSLSRKDFGGNVEEAQLLLSRAVQENKDFLSVFDAFVMEVILPSFKHRLLMTTTATTITTTTKGTNNNNKNNNHHHHQEKKKDAEETTKKFTFYYQRPPTLRLQPGPATKSYVKHHRDSQYGHQDAELNYWIPLSFSPTTTTTTTSPSSSSLQPSTTIPHLWIESTPNQSDYHPLKLKNNQGASFHGSSCRHYVPKNESVYTRVSLDFRVGVEEFGFDCGWKMVGTKDDHIRCKVIL